MSLPTPATPDHPDGDWQPFAIPTTDGLSIDAEYRREGATVAWRVFNSDGIRFNTAEAHRLAHVAAFPHPTRTIEARITCVLVDDDGFEITVEQTGELERWERKSWRFAVVDANRYPVGSTITLEVPA